MFRFLKDKFREVKQSYTLDKEIKEDLKARDRAYKEYAKKQAYKEFLEQRNQKLEERKQALLNQERKKYEQRLKTIESPKKKQINWDKLSNVSKKIVGDGKTYGSNLNLSNSVSGITDRLERNLGISKPNKPRRKQKSKRPIRKF